MIQRREMGSKMIFFPHVKEILHLVLATRMDGREFLKWMIDTGMYARHGIGVRW